MQSITIDGCLADVLSEIVWLLNELGMPYEFKEASNKFYVVACRTTGFATFCIRVSGGVDRNAWTVHVQRMFGDRLIVLGFYKCLCTMKVDSAAFVWEVRRPDGFDDFEPAVDNDTFLPLTLLASPHDEVVASGVLMIMKCTRPCADALAMLLQIVEDSTCTRGIISRTLAALALVRCGVRPEDTSRLDAIARTPYCLYTSLLQRYAAELAGSLVTA